MIVVAQWGNLNRWKYLHQVAVLFSLAERTNYGRVWPEPLLSISTCCHIENHVKFKNPSWSGSAAPVPPLSDPKIQWNFKINKGNKMFDTFLIFYILKQFLSQHRIDGCEY
jgi:hypothetical protein